MPDVSYSINLALLLSYSTAFTLWSPNLAHCGLDPCICLAFMVLARLLLSRLSRSGSSFTHSGPCNIATNYYVNVNVNSCRSICYDVDMWTVHLRYGLKLNAM